MPEQNLEWKEVNQFGIGKIMQDVDSLTKQVIGNQINEIGGKLQMLETMGIVQKDNEQLKTILNEIEKLRKLK